MVKFYYIKVVIIILTKLILKNYKSFKDKTIIDFKKTNYKVLDKLNTNNGILKGLMFVGANASGKSNILKSIRFLLDMLFREVKIHLEFNKCLFCDKDEFSLEFTFSIEGNEIIYFIEFIPQKNFIIEKLYLNSKLLLDRMGTNAQSFITDKQNFTDLDNDKLFLRTIYFNTGFANNHVLKTLFIFLQNSVYINPFENTIISYEGKSDFILLNYLKNNGADEINSFFNEYNFNQTLDYSDKSFGENILDTVDKQPEKKSVFFKRKGINVPIPYNFESLGNRTLIELLPSFIYLCKNNGLLLIDEFSSGFHNELEELLVRYFMAKSEKSQIVFVTHSTNLLTTSLLRPDQIYTVNFSDENGSYLKRFSDEQPRVAQNLEKMYMSGVFGGLPNYKDIYDIE